MSDKIFLEGGVAWKIKNGKRVSVKSIIAPEGEDCCKLDCCGDEPAIEYYSQGEGAVIRIPLDDIARTLGIIQD